MNQGVDEWNYQWEGEKPRDEQSEWTTLWHEALLMFLLGFVHGVKMPMEFPSEIWMSLCGFLLSSLVIQSLHSDSDHTCPRHPTLTEPDSQIVMCIDMCIGGWETQQPPRHTFGLEGNGNGWYILRILASGPFVRNCMCQGTDLHLHFPGMVLSGASWLSQPVCWELAHASRWLALLPSRSNIKEELFCLVMAFSFPIYYID